MGKKNNPITDTEGAGASSENNPSAETSSQTKRGRGRPRKDGSESRGAKTSPDVPRLVLVEDPNGSESDPEETAAPAAPKNPTKRKRKDVQYEIKKEQLAVLIKTTFDIIGSREGMEIWKMSKQESELIADPLSALMAKNPIVDRLTSEYGDWIALIVAIGTVIVPRLFVMWAAKPKKKEPVKPYVAIKEPNEKQGASAPKPATGGDKSGAAGNSNKQPDRLATNARSYIGTELHGIIPAIQ